VKPIVFLDRDGTILVEPTDDFRIKSFDRFEFMPNVIEALKKIQSLNIYHFVLVTNQDGLGSDTYPLEHFEPFQEKMLQVLASNGISFLGIHIDVSTVQDNKNTRKPGIGMLSNYIDNQDMFNIKNSIVIGDSKTDIQLAKNLGCASILIENEHNTESYSSFTEDEEKAIIFRSNSWEKIREFIVDLHHI
jgi:imidazoleglycerol-phosphate dehydratase/histidinol-phosphatase